ncbi:MAG: hypothetical protein QXV85_10140 [Candidatus Bathyarchaeia archaeon]
MNSECRKRCVACGSNDGVINHYLSYSPEIIIPLCRKCHYYAHHDERKYGNPLSRNPDGYNALTLRGFVIALKVRPSEWVCTLCRSKVSTEKEVVLHFATQHATQIGGKPIKISRLKASKAPSLLKGGFCTISSKGLKMVDGLERVRHS